LNIGRGGGVGREPHVGFDADTAVDGNDGLLVDHAHAVRAGHGQFLRAVAPVHVVAVLVLVECDGAPVAGGGPIRKCGPVCPTDADVRLLVTGHAGDRAAAARPGALAGQHVIRVVEAVFEVPLATAMQ